MHPYMEDTTIHGLLRLYLPILPSQTTPETHVGLSSSAL